MTQSNASNDAMNDSLNFVKKLWGQMGVPGMSMPQMSSMPGMTMPGLPGMALPTMSIDDLDKRIQELKTVETWLNVNMTMLRNTIQALEVQRATIATLHSLSSTMAKTMQGMGDGATNMFAGGAASPDPEESDEIAETDDGEDQEQEEVTPLIAQSAVWWQGVQDQFKQALGTALEKSTANYEAAKSASEKIVKATATPKAKAPPKRAKATAPKTKVRAPAKSAAKATSRSTAKPARKAPTRAASKSTGKY